MIPPKIFKTEVKCVLIPFRQKLLGISVTLTSDFWRGLQKSVRMAAIYIFKVQQRKFIRKLQFYGGNIIIIIDGTYSVRGSHSPDCFVRVEIE